VELKEIMTSIGEVTYGREVLVNLLGMVRFTLLTTASKKQCYIAGVTQRNHAQYRMGGETWLGGSCHLLGVTF